MNRITTIGLDLAKKVFQIHGVDEQGNVVVARQLRRKEVLAYFARLPACLVGMRRAAVRTTGRARSPSSATP
jgi:transposase